MLLRINILSGNLQIFIVIETDAHILGHIVSGLTSAEDGRSAFADTNCIAGSIGVETENLASFDQQLIVGDKACADVDEIDAVDELFCAWYRLEIFAFGDYSASDGRAVGIRHRTDEGVARHDRDAQTTDAIGLDWEAAFMGHGFDDGPNISASLHALIGGQVTDIAGSDGQDVTSQECMFLVHHLLEDRCGVDARDVIVFKRRHERNRTSGDNQMVGINIRNLLSIGVFDSYAASLEKVPDSGIEEDAIGVLSRKGSGNIEPTHTTKMFLFFEKEKLVGLHIELTANTRVVVDDEVVDAKGIQLFATGETCRASTNNGHFGLINIDRTRLRIGGFGQIVLR